MKGFTTLMKISIMLVSIALVAMLVVSAAPLVMGGVDVKQEEEIGMSLDGSNMKLSGVFVVKSAIEEDISDLTLKVYLVSQDGSLTKDMVNLGPYKLDKENPEVRIDLGECDEISLPEVAAFFVTDNMDNEKAGLVLPVTIQVKGSYSNNLAGVDMKVVYDAKLSDKGKISIGETAKTTSGDISKASVKISGIETSDMIDDIIGSGIDAKITMGGKDINLGVVKDGADYKFSIETGDLAKDALKDSIKEILDAISKGEDKPIAFTYGGETYNVNPADLTEETSKYAAEIEAISDALTLFLDKYAEITEASS